MTGPEAKPARDGLKWTRDEHVIAFNLYNQLPFGQFDRRTPSIIQLARLLGRTPDSLAMKLSNFARFDPSLQARNIVGLPRGAKGEEVVWREFADNPEALAYESETLLARLRGQSVERTADIPTDDLPPPGVDREAVVKLRVNQQFFRRRILSAYKFQCCITGLGVPMLLTASHIIPWAEDAANRLNPRNGLCLNALHDRAFDRKLLWVEDDLTVRLSPRLSRRAAQVDAALAWVLSFEDKKLILPEGFSPDLRFIAKHREQAHKLAG